MLSSSFEGYPLSTLESMSRGCPVVSYDIKYGPREQITDGVDGFLVPRGDVDALADRLVELLRSPELVARMSRAARETARRKGPDEFLADWARVLGERGRAAPQPGRAPRRRARDDAAADRPWRTAAIAGVLHIEARTRRAKLASARVTLAAIDDATGDVSELPLKVKVDDGALKLHTPAGLLGGPSLPENARLRLRLMWENATWETELTPERTPRRSAATRRVPA